MPAKRSSISDFQQRRSREGWTPVAEYADFQGFANFKRYSGDKAHARFGAYAMGQVAKFYPEVEREAGPGASNQGPITVLLDEGESQFFVSIVRKAEGYVLTWSCLKKDPDQPVGPVLDGAGCLSKLGLLALGKRQDVRLPMPEQEDKAFMWKAPSFHPLQVLENAYQRVVRKAGHDAESDQVQAQTDALSKYFIQEPASPELFEYKPLDEFDGAHLAAVKMNHLIDSFYLFRLLVNFRVEADQVTEDLRAELSGDLTKLLHNGDKTKMQWLSDWLTIKIGELGARANALNTKGQQRVIFFLKGGRALNYFLGTPEKGENDWDTQVVINPNLSAQEWYACLAEVHDAMLLSLKTFKTEFTQLVQDNAPQFSQYLAAVAGPQEVDDEEIDEHEAGDVDSLKEHANCKAELIDIGLPRRDSPSALEEWTHLSAPGALLQSNGVIYPHREYYLNEYLMMVRDAFTSDEVRKAPKRITRLGLILQSDRGREQPSPAQAKRLAALPGTAAMLDALDNKGKQELFRLIVAQFVEAYNLHQDTELAAHFDKECTAMIARPPALPPTLDALLDAGQKEAASIVGVAHALSVQMDAHWTSRNQFFETQLPFFTDLVQTLSAQTSRGLLRVGAQFAVAGSYAARLHARHLRIQVDGLEPIRRILIKLQCIQGSNKQDVMNAVRDDIRKAAQATKKLRVAEVSEPDKQNLLIYWNEKVQIGNLSYAPLVMKVRVAEQKGAQLPVLASIEAMPVLDPRYLVADYLKKTSKIDERGARQVLASATAAVSEMLSKFDIESDDPD
ncbi:hypothetical protein QTI66_28590 [Variovorax sp. J22R133]|uniref:hypothetical protein n=1 Tax=Variovorax brevis TaxID=3053503 RepID=UPI0025784BC8|nr:hypothetical protein [Variovorax sp. J22R133]MDM0116133.1 hypothetical protein [Variovorax sp. J22R133]